MKRNFRVFHALSCFLLGVFLVGCAAKRDEYHVPQVPVPDTFYQSRALEDPAVVSFDQTPLESILPDWWRVLGNTELDRLMDMALARNQDLRIASFRVAHSQARYRQAYGEQWPTISVPARAGIEAPEQGVGDNPRGEKVRSQNIFEMSLRGDWRVDLWGEKSASAQAAQYRFWMATFEHEAARMNVTAQVASAYAQYLALTDRINVARESERVVMEMLRSVKERLEYGESTRLDYEQQRSAVYGVKAVIPELELQRDEVFHRLSRLVGVTPSDLETFEDTLLSLGLPRVSPGVPSSLLLLRPDVRSAEADLLASDADIDVARARILPPLDLTAQIGYGSRHLSQLFMPHSLAYNAIASITATLFDGGVRRNEEIFARARNEELVEHYIRVIYDAVTEVEDALATIRRTEQRLAAIDAACEASERALDYSRELFNLQAIDYLTVLITERTHHQNLDQRIQIQLERYLGTIRLFQALGGGSAVSEPLPGKGHRPDHELTVAGGLILADPVEPVKETGIVWDPPVWPEEEREHLWLVELSGLYDRTAAYALVRDLHKELQDFMLNRELLAVESGVQREDGRQRLIWYRLRLLPAADDKDKAQQICDILAENKRRCHVVKP